MAAEKGDHKIVELLLAKGTKPDAQDNDGISALMEAAANGHGDTVALLLEHGADKSVKDKIAKLPWTTQKRKNSNR